MIRIGAGGSLLTTNDETKQLYAANAATTSKYAVFASLPGELLTRCFRSGLCYVIV